MNVHLGNMTDKEALENSKISDDLRLAKIFKNHEKELAKYNFEVYKALEQWYTTHRSDFAYEEEYIRSNPEFNECWDARRRPLPFMYRGMEDARVDLNDAMWYLIDMFEQTKRYSATKTKIAKLLSIAAFKYAMNNKVLFSTYIYKYPNCGCFIADVDALMTMSDYLLMEYEDAPEVVPSPVLNEISEPVNKYARCLTNKPAQTVLKSVFANFGAYRVQDLNKVLIPLWKIRI